MFDATHLVDRIQRGDDSAEDELVRLFQREVLIGLRRRTHDNEASRELANDVLMAVVCALRAGRLLDSTKLRAFVRGIVRNLANNFLRTRRSRPYEEPLPPDVFAKEAPDGVEERERLAAMKSSLERLGPTDQEILRLTIVDGLKPGQIALRMGLSGEVVRARKSRALHRLILRAQHAGV